ncbi:hypothetical protein IT41_06695 [Paracoccus halophilus]|uniref:Uncharacterized protein n=1 Tax=Paracoccus halophilus TaxID=376733 RepID=A0A099F5N3_9RHOB|nr:hypothetical protein [Paracoccus halophilus]KGJ05447.1 hypothetical protein IT41_06695 [Paracoccus halophilus]
MELIGGQILWRRVSGEVSDALQQFRGLASEHRLQHAAEILGADPGTAEGLLAAMAHALALEADNLAAADRPHHFFLSAS